MKAVDQIRTFNRTVTQQVGALQGRFLGSSRSLGACRLLFEIGPHGADIRDLRARLGLDSGYLSRLLRGLESEGLIDTSPSPRDARARSVTLTPAGGRELSRLNRRSDAAARSLLQRLSPAHQQALIAGMGTVERVLLAGAVQLRVEPPTTRAAAYCLHSYFDELARRFEAGYDPTRGIPATAADLTPPRGYLVVADLHGKPVGCGALKVHPRYGEIKRMWVAPSSRGLGIGARILERLEGIARKRQLRLLRLETNKALTEAQALYRKCGYREVRPFNSEPYAHHWFEKTL